MPKGRNDISFKYNKAEKEFQPKVEFLSTDKTQLLDQLIQKNIFASMAIRKDSSVTFVIRTRHIPEYRLNIREHLIKSKSKNRMVVNEFVKDTVVSGWNYRIWLDKRQGW